MSEDDPYESVPEDERVKFGLSTVLAIKRKLEFIADKGTAVDSASGLGGFDFWITIDDVEYYTSMKPSGKMKAGMS